MQIGPSSCKPSVFYFSTIGVLTPTEMHYEKNYIITPQHSAKFASSAPFPSAAELVPKIPQRKYSRRYSQGCTHLEGMLTNGGPSVPSTLRAPPPDQGCGFSSPICEKMLQHVGVDTCWLTHECSIWPLLDTPPHPKWGADLYA